MKKRKWIIPLALVACAAGLALILSGRPQSDEVLAAELAGRWRAVDLSNAALHKQKESVAAEEIVVEPDGDLIYSFATLTTPTKPRTDKWGWRVRKGRLSLQFRGDSAADDWMPSMRFTVSRDKLAIMRKGFPAKEFTRVDS